MNCDRVFCVLTSGPFPTGDSSDEAVEAHLVTCPECRRLAEALRPAARLRDEPGLHSTNMIGRMVEEIVGAEERRRLPGYWGEASGEAADEILARFSETRETPAAPEQSSPRRWPFGARFSGAWLFVFAAALGVASVGAMRLWSGARDEPLWGGAGHRVSSAHAAQGPKADSPRLLATNSQLLANLRLPPACTTPPADAAGQLPAGRSAMGRSASERQPSHSLASFPAAAARQVCCTECHHAGAGKEIPAAAASAVRHNCQLCHGDMVRAAADAW